MAQSPVPPESDDDLQFTTVEPASSAAVRDTGHTCAACHQPITSTYYAVGDQMICPACSAQFSGPPQGSRVGRLMKASLLGIGAGLVGAAIWFAIRRFAHLEIGLVAILVGFMVGKAVRAGSGNRGGRAYQVLAVIITYSCIAANLMPDMIEFWLTDLRGDGAIILGEGEPQQAEAANDPNAGAPDPAVQPHANEPVKVSPLKAIATTLLVLLYMFLIALAAPFLAGIENLIGLLIIGFALWEAWQFNRRAELAITGPYELNPQPAS